MAGHVSRGDPPGGHALCSARSLLAAVLMVLCLCSWAAHATELDEIDIRANFTNYWSAIADHNYKRATAYIHPLQLSQLRTQVLPVFLQGAQSPNAEVRVVVDMFFGDVPPEQRAGLSGPEISILFHKIIFTALPDVARLLKVARPEILEIAVDGPNQATVRYKLSVEGESIEQTQTLGKFNGRWYLNFNESPQAVAAKFQRVFR